MKKIKASRKHINKEGTDEFSRNFTDLRIMSHTEDPHVRFADTRTKSTDTHGHINRSNNSRDLRRDFTTSRSVLLTKEDKLYHDHENHMEKISTIKSKENEELRKMRNNVFTNK